MRHLDAGGLVLTKTKVDAGAVEQIVGRTYKHPALGERAVVRLASDRLGKAEDLAMEFLGFQAPSVTAPVGQQQRRSLSFAAWALVNDSKNARYALDLVKQMKKAARQASSKPGHAWDAYTAMAKDLGKSAPHFLPPFWEEVGRNFKDLGNQTYAGRALNKSVEAERVHALDSDKARRRDVVLEFVLAGCMSGTALSEYGDDLAKQYPPAEAFAVFRDLSERRTRGGMAPWGTLTKDFAKLAKAAKLAADDEIERWLEEVIDAPAMGRAPQQFWKACSAHCKRIVARNPGFAVALLRHTRPDTPTHSGNKLDEWLEMLESWGVFEFLWEDGARGAPPLGEPIATWFGRILRNALPAPARTLDMLQKLAPRLKKENIPLPLSIVNKWGYSNGIDVDVLETCLSMNLKVDDPPASKSIVYDDAALDGPPRYFVHIDFTGWLLATPDHPLRNQDLMACTKDPRFEMSIRSGLDQALQCKGGPLSRGYRMDPLEQRPFPLATAERPGVTALWRQHTERVIANLENTGLASFQSALDQLRATLWPDTLRLFPDLAQRLLAVDPVDMLQRTLQAGVLDEYGLPALEQVVDEGKITVIASEYNDRNLFLFFPNMIVHDKVHATVIGADGKVTRHELRLPAKGRVETLLPIGNDLLVGYRDPNWHSKMYWASDPAQVYDARAFYGSDSGTVTPLADGAYFLGEGYVRPGDKQIPKSKPYFHDGQRFWQAIAQYDQAAQRSRWKAVEVDPHTGKELRASVPAWFEESDEGTVELGSSELISAPTGTENSPLGQKDGLLGWKAIERRDGTFVGVGIDGRRWEKRIAHPQAKIPQGLLRQPGGEGYLPITADKRNSDMIELWDPSGSTMVSMLQCYQRTFAPAQVTVLPLRYWHLLKVRDEASSNKLRTITRAECEALFAAAAQDQARSQGASKPEDDVAQRLQSLFTTVLGLLPTAPPRLVSGLAQMVSLAYAERTGLNEIREKPGTKKDAAEQPSGHGLSDLAAMLWSLTNNNAYGVELDGDEAIRAEVSTSANLLGTLAFFKGEREDGPLPWSGQVWYPMLGDLPLRAWQTYWWQATAKFLKYGGQIPGPWLEFLKLWQQSSLFDLAGNFSLIEAAPPTELKFEEQGKSFAFTQGADKFVGMNSRGQNWASRTFFLRYSTSDTPSVPKGFEVIDTRELKVRYDAEQIAAFIAAVEAASALPLPTREELAATAQTLSVTPAEVALVWLAGLRMDAYEANFLPSELRNALGLKTTEASAARLALRNVPADVRVQLFASVVSESMAAPFAADRGPTLRALERTWQSKIPRRVTIGTELQKRLASFNSNRWDQKGQGELLAAAADPAKHPLLQPRDYEIWVRPNTNWQQFELAAKGTDQRAPSVQVLTTLVQLAALVHAETPAGHAARTEMAALVKQLAALVNHPGFLLWLRSVYIQPDAIKQGVTATLWLNQHVGKTKVNPKEAIARLDDGLIAAAGDDAHHQVSLAFRPAKLKSEVDRQRLQGLLALGVLDATASADRMLSGVLQIVDLIRNAGFQKLAKAILAKDLEAGQWPANPLLTAPDVVKAIQKKHKLSEDAAAYYAQLLALPEPTNANVGEWNGWKPAQLKAAAAELVKQKLVLEATRARAGRSVFLPGEWSELKAPWLPIESWKQAHLVEKDAHLQANCPLGGPMVLRPFGELFAAAWQRVLDGDAPGYEEVQRSKKKK